MARYSPVFDAAQFRGWDCYATLAHAITTPLLIRSDKIDREDGVYRVRCIHRNILKLCQLSELPFPADKMLLLSQLRLESDSHQ